ncbi:MAG: DUF2177 family protein [Thermoanaerobaculales bacterium]|nr:DUF2177 family protein [Thermoanaerobaculales bacterium]
MNIPIFLKLYAVAVVTFFVIDLVWLGVVARSFYQNQMGHLMRAEVNWTAAIVFYLIFVVGIVVLAVWPAVERQSLGHAIALGALLGLVTYAAYDLTNLATLDGFPFGVVLVDMAWGTVLCGSVSAVTYLASARLLPSGAGP